MLPFSIETGYGLGGPLRVALLFAPPMVPMRITSTVKNR
nr:MAG TPA: hypothetical protein [Caudoviricetes sp.]